MKNEGVEVKGKRMNEKKGWLAGSVIKLIARRLLEQRQAEKISVAR